MFIYSVRASTLKFCGTLVLGVLLVSALVIFLPPATEPGAVITGGEISYEGIEGYPEMVEFLHRFGWEAEQNPEDDRKVIIPENFGKTFAEYNRLQQSQGLDLQNYAGKEVRKVVFALKNYKGAQGKVLATLFVYRERIVGGDISSADPGGFVAPLEGEKRSEG